jgi:uncharacterized protein YbaR (Trm112 family)
MKRDGTDMMTEVELFDLLACPKTRQRVKPAAPELVRQINDQIQAGSLKNCAGRVVTEKLDGALVTADGRYLYPVRQSIPILLWEEAVPAPGLA